MVELNILVDYLDELLEVDRFNDYCPNGLQVEGVSEVKHIVTGVTACQALLDRAAAVNADLVLVHHGYFWKGESPCLTGMKRARLKTLLLHDISLLAYHLPLDAHPVHGNNAGLAKALGIVRDGDLGYSGVGNFGHLQVPESVQDFTSRLQNALGRVPQHISGGKQYIESVAWCSGGAQDGIGRAVELGVDAYVSGEISERTVHVAREAGVDYFAAGHHATERLGVQALGEHLEKQFGLQHQYIEIENPV